MQMFEFKKVSSLTIAMMLLTAGCSSLATRLTDKDWDTRYDARKDYDKLSLSEKTVVQKELAEIAKRKPKSWSDDSTTYAVSSISDQALLLDVLQNVRLFDYYGYQRERFVESLMNNFTDQSMLANLAKCHKDEDVRLKAAKRLSDKQLMNSVLMELVLNSKSPGRREPTLKAIDDQRLLIAKMADLDRHLKGIALEKITDHTLISENQSVFLEIAKDGMYGDATRMVAIQKIEDQAVLKEILEECHNIAIQKAIVEKLTDPAILEDVALNGKVEVHYTEEELRQQKKKRIEMGLLDDGPTSYFKVRWPEEVCQLALARLPKEHVVWQRVYIEECEEYLKKSHNRVKRNPKEDFAALNKLTSESKMILATTTRYYVSYEVKRAIIEEINDVNLLAQIAKGRPAYETTLKELYGDKFKVRKKVRKEDKGDAWELYNEMLSVSEIISKIALKRLILLDANQAIFYDLTLNAFEERIQEEAFKELIALKPTQECFTEIALNTNNRAIWRDAVNRVTDQMLIARLVIHDKAKEGALKKLTNQQAICEVAKKAKSGSVKMNAFRMLTDPELIGEVTQIGDIKFMTELQTSAGELSSGNHYIKDKFIWTSDVNIPNGAIVRINLMGQVIDAKHIVVNEGATCELYNGFLMCNNPDPTGEVRNDGTLLFNHVQVKACVKNHKQGVLTLTNQTIVGDEPLDAFAVNAGVADLRQEAKLHRLFGNSTEAMGKEMAAELILSIKETERARVVINEGTLVGENSLIYRLKDVSGNAKLTNCKVVHSLKE